MSEPEEELDQIEKEILAARLSEIAQPPDEEEFVPPVTQTVTVAEPVLSSPAAQAFPISQLSEATQVPPEQLDPHGLKQLVSGFVTQVARITSNTEADRIQLQGAIDALDARIKGALNGETPVPQIYVESWAKLLVAKADINANASSVLDSVAKLLAALKKSDVIVNNNNTNAPGSLDLISLLSKKD